MMKVACGYLTDELLGWSPQGADDVIEEKEDDDDGDYTEEYTDDDDGSSDDDAASKVSYSSNGTYDYGK